MDLQEKNTTGFYFPGKRLSKPNHGTRDNILSVYSQFFQPNINSKYGNTHSMIIYDHENTEILPRCGLGMSMFSNPTSMRNINNSVLPPSGPPDLPMPKAKNIRNYLNQNLTSNVLTSRGLPQKNNGMSFRCTQNPQNISNKTGASGRRTGLTRRQNFYNTSENFRNMRSNILRKGSIINSKSGKKTESPRGDQNLPRTEIIQEFCVKDQPKDEPPSDRADSKENNKFWVGAGGSHPNLYTFEVVNKNRLRFAGRGKGAKNNSRDSGRSLDSSKGRVDNNCR